jgi:hypothetical protein
MKKFVTGFFLISIIFVACTKSGGDAVTVDPDPNPGGATGGNSCDTVNMKYMADVVPIMQQNCYRCHGASTNSGSFGIVLEGHGNLKPYAESGTLLGVITHAQGFIPMPQDAGKLSECSINKIRSWIANGMQNN